jgi:hypothetical protein
MFTITNLMHMIWQTMFDQDLTKHIQHVKKFENFSMKNICQLNPHICKNKKGKKLEGKHMYLISIL